MVTTRAREVLTNHAGGHPRRTERQGTILSVPHSPPTSAALINQLAIFNQQVQALNAAVHTLQKQRLGASQQHPKSLASLMIAAPVSQRPTRGRSHQREVYCHQVSPKHRHCEAFKRLRSPAFCSSSEPSREDLNPVMKKHLDEQHRRLEELTQSLSNRPEVDCSTGSRIISKRNEFETLPVTSSIYGHFNS